jgi:hypothetical protein
MMFKALSVLFAGSLFFAACSSSESSQGGTGGSSATGGHTQGGDSGRQGSGGQGSGGSQSTGGKIGTGGSGSGGTTTASGGSGGSAGEGGTPGSGGAKGGATGSGGTTGPTSDGGIAAGGVGGITSRDGGVGGINGTGGTPSGGSSGAGGGTSKPGYYPPAGTAGVAKPSGAGSKVTVLDWAGFKGGAVSFTFDDANSSQISNYAALQKLNDKGNNVRYTFYLQTGKTDASNAIWKTAMADGHELGNHTKSHQSAASTSDIDAAEQFIKSNFSYTSYSVAAPNGDNSYVNTVAGMKEFMTNRTAGNNGAISANTDPSTKQWQLPCIIPATGAASSAMQSSISSAISGGKWVTFLVHGFSGGSDSAYQPVAIGEFTSTVSWAKTQGNIWIDSVENVSAYWIAAYKFAKLTPAASGSDKTWTWKVTDFNNPYPSGKSLRVTTDGGTLKQGDKTLEWDDHGYYEVALDAGTLTLSP